MTERFRIAQILRPHGVKGEVKLYPLTDDMSRFKRLKEAYTEREGQYEAVVVTGCKFVSGSAVISIEGVTSPEEAEKLRGLYLCVDRAHAVKLPEGTYFVADIIGCEVFSTDGSALGQVREVLETNANDVYVIEGQRRLMVPALKKLLRSVDVSNKRIELDAEVLSEVGLFED
ncbi:MAG: 16S rRNA processing protein RimM [Clostridia bacterium]|jgi:16S rRNA processing protein RimM|nr:16S rRNA processing protein RimM [Clostridia bacterium]MBQ4448273.1 16S rRNA processing protein RimM [Clostridia bacterium]MBR3486442.1 16S rRNA processing protein RimM [Clostridia bacterium]